MLPAAFDHYAFISGGSNTPLRNGASQSLCAVAVRLSSCIARASAFHSDHSDHFFTSSSAASSSPCLFSSPRSSSTSEMHHTTSSSPQFRAEAHGIPTQHTMESNPRAKAQNDRYVASKITMQNYALLPKPSASKLSKKPSIGNKPPATDASMSLLGSSLQK